MIGKGRDRQRDLLNDQWALAGVIGILEARAGSAYWHHAARDTACHVLGEIRRDAGTVGSALARAALRRIGNPQK